MDRVIERLSIRRNVERENWWNWMIWKSMAEVYCGINTYGKNTATTCTDCDSLVKTWVQVWRGWDGDDVEINTKHSRTRNSAEITGIACQRRINALRTARWQVLFSG